LKTEIKNLKQILKSYEDQNLKLTEMEKKLRSANAKHEKDMKSIEEKYKEKIKQFTQKLQNFEDMSKTRFSYKPSSNEEEGDRMNVKIISNNIV
jgi:hypothetical protein